MSSKEYLLLNIIFTALLFCLFVSVYFIDPATFITCQVMELTGTECSSCGLTRDFISFGHLNFETPINKNSIFVFAWFGLQFLVRILLIILPSNIRIRAALFDLMLSVITAIAVFLPFWI